ncbi:MAG: pilus assembly protein N-terminal domain-containing protein, partial [Planctomycetota bacterium]
MKTLNLLQAGICGMITAVLLSSGPSVVTAQHLGNRLGQQTFVDSSVEEMEVIVGSSQRLKFGYKIPELLVENPEVVTATPISPTEILVRGVKPGVSSLTVSDPEKNLQTIVIQVTADTRKLESALKRHFPNANIQVHALQTGVVLKGTVVRADDVNTVVAIARDYFPTTVINRLDVDSGQVVAIKVKVYEVNRSKLRTLGIDWAILSPDFRLASSVSDIISAVSLSDAEFDTGGSQTLSLGVFDGQTTFFKFLEALEANNVAKLLDEPTLVAQNGRPAEFLSGGEIPILVASGLGTNSIEFRAFGTKLDMVPLIHGQGELTLEVRAEVSDVDNSLAFGTGVPGFRVRRVNTGVRMKAGHTLALA